MRDVRRPRVTHTRTYHPPTQEVNSAHSLPHNPTRQHQRQPIRQEDTHARRQPAPSNPHRQPRPTHTKEGGGNAHDGRPE